MRNHNLLPLVIQCILLVSAIVRVHFYAQSTNKECDTCSIDGVLLDYPKIKKRFQYITLKGYKIITSKSPKYGVGSTLHVTTHCDGQGTGMNNFRGATLLWPEISLIDTNHGSLLTVSANWRNNVIERANELLPMPYSSLFLGIVFGIYQELPDGLYSMFYNGGILHVIVASGYNVSVLVSILFLIFKRFNLYVHLVLTTLVLVLYLLISGITAPLVRATIMGLLFLSSRLSGIVINKFVLLFFTFNLMLLVNPSYAYNIGFWMSFVAMLALLLHAGLFKSDTGINSPGFYNSLSESTMVNLFLVPISGISFDTVTLGGFIANPLALWIVPFVMVFGLLYFVTGYHFFGHVIIAFLDLFIFIVSAVGKYVHVVTLDVNLWWWVLYYLILFFLYRVLYLLFRKDYE